MKSSKENAAVAAQSWVSLDSAPAVRAAMEGQKAALAAYDSGAGGIGAVRAAAQAMEEAHSNSVASVQSRALASAINEHGAKLPGGVVVTARVQVGSAVAGKVHSVEVTGKKLGSSHVSVRTLTGPTDHAKVIADMQSSLQSQVKEAKAKAKFQPERTR